MVSLRGLQSTGYPGGSQRKAGRYTASRREGHWRAWFAEGPPMCEGIYADDRMVGEWTWFDIHGDVLARHVFNDRGLPEGYTGSERRYREVHLDPGDPTVCDRCGVSRADGTSSVADRRLVSGRAEHDLCALPSPRG